MKNVFEEEIFETQVMGLACCVSNNFNILTANQTFWNYVGQTKHGNSIAKCFKDFPEIEIVSKLEILNSYSCLVYSVDETSCFDLLISKRSNEECSFLFIECFKREELPNQVDPNDKLKNILATTDKTYFIIDKTCKIEEAYNIGATPIIDQHPENKQIEDVLHLSKKDRNDLHFSIELLESNLLEWEDFESLNDEQTTIGQHIYHVQFKQYEQRSDELKLFVTIKDITEDIREQRQREESNALQKMIYTIMCEQESFVRFLRECDKIIQTMMHELEQEELTKSQIHTLFRAVHTIKGNASAFDMVKVAKYAEEAENYLRSLRSQSTDIDEDSLDQLRDNILNLIDMFNDTRELLSKSLGSVFDDWESGKVHIPKEKLVELNQLVESDPVLKRHEDLRKLTQSFFNKPIKQLLDRYSKLVSKLASQCNKTIHPLEITGGDIQVNTDIYAPFSESLVHVFRNAIDHGIETPEIRKDSGKDEYGRIKISVLQDLEYISMIIEDDGGGINPSIIRRIAKDRSVITAEEIEQLSDEEVIDLIFAPGFSTADEVTDVSGNGVGMDAVRTSVRDLGGEITVLSTLGSGTKFYIDIPIQ